MFVGHYDVGHADNHNDFRETENNEDGHAVCKRRIHDDEASSYVYKEVEPEEVADFCD